MNQGEGDLEEYNPEIEKQRVNPPYQMEDKGGGQGLEDWRIQKTLQNLQSIVEVLLQEREEKMKKHAAHGDKGKKKGVDHDPTKKPPSPPSSPSSPSSTHFESSNIFKGGHKARIKLDVNFDLPKYCGELNPKKLDNWIQKVEVYLEFKTL